MSNTFTVVTSFPISHWNIYGERFVTSFIKHWPTNVRLLCYCDGFPLPPNAPTAPNVEYIDLLGNNDLITFKERNKQFNGKSLTNTGVYNFYEDAVKFSHKVYAQNMAMAKVVEAAELLEEKTKASVDAGWLVWVDADSVTYEDMPLSLLTTTFKDDYDLAFLGRKKAYATCSSIIGYNLQSTVSQVFMGDYVNYYNSDEVLKLKCFADNFVFDRLRILHEVHGMRTNNLTPNCEGLDAFEQSPFNPFMVHFKGNKKYTQSAAPHAGLKASRYYDLINIVKMYKRKNLLEVGTWSGDTACAMIQAAFEAGTTTVHYTGIDLFEEATSETDKREFNVKTHPSFKAVSLKFEDLAGIYAAEGKTLTYHLIKGDSREKLKILNDGSLCGLYNIFPDFVFIDGGHSRDTVKSDYNYCKGLPVLILDDYYTQDDSGKLPEIRGVNDLWDELGGSKLKTSPDDPQRRVIIPSRDPVVGGGIVNLVAIINDLQLDKMPDMRRVPVQVNPRDSVPPDNIQNNVRENLKMFKTNNSKMVDRCRWHGEEAVIASAGPSLMETIDKIKELQQAGAKVVCVKHSIQTLVDNGVMPWGCVILDARPFDGISTHGIVRRDLFKTVHKDVRYFVASMTNPDVTKYILDNGGNVVGWNAYTSALQTMPEMMGKQMITGGTCSAMRAIGLMHTIGFRKFHIFGMDCSYNGEPPNKDETDLYGKKKWLKVGILNKQKDKEDIFWTTGELLALAQDFEALLEREATIDMDLAVYGRGMVPTIFANAEYKSLPLYMDMISL